MYHSGGAVRTSPPRRQEGGYPSAVGRSGGKTHSGIETGQAHDFIGRGGAYTACAFHPNEKITNFCTNRECLLPLCPKCVKIHAEEHQKMGIFGEFDTIADTINLCENGLQYSLGRVGELERSFGEMRDAYQEKLGQERRRIREAKNLFVEYAEKVFDRMERAMLNFTNQENKVFIEGLFQSEMMLNHLNQHYRSCSTKVGNSSTLMQGIINFLSEADEVETLAGAEQRLHNSFPKAVTINWEEAELERLEGMVRRYLNFGHKSELVSSHYKQLQNQRKDRQKSSGHKASPDKSLTPQKYNPKVQSLSLNHPKYEAKQTIGSKSATGTLPQIEGGLKRTESRPSEGSKLAELTRVQANLNLARFKSPLDEFSLAEHRRTRGQA